MILLFFICILSVLAINFSNLIFGNQHDCCFSENTIKKLIVPNDSFLRKLVIFKDNKMTNPPFLYIRVIPYLVQWLIVIVNIALFLINQFVINFMPSIVFMIVGYCSLGTYVIYELILIFLSRGLRL